METEVNPFVSEPADTTFRARSVMIAQLTAPQAAEAHRRLFREAVDRARTVQNKLGSWRADDFWISYMWPLWCWQFGTEQDYAQIGSGHRTAAWELYKKGCFGLQLIRLSLFEGRSRLDLGRALMHPRARGFASLDALQRFLEPENLNPLSNAFVFVVQFDKQPTFQPVPGGFQGEVKTSGFRATPFNYATLVGKSEGKWVWEFMDQGFFISGDPTTSTVYHKSQEELPPAAANLWVVIPKK